MPSSTNGQLEEDNGIHSWATLNIRYGLMRRFEKILTHFGDYLASDSAPSLRPTHLESQVYKYTTSKPGGGTKDEYDNNGQRLIQLIKDGIQLGIHNDQKLVAAFWDRSALEGDVESPPPPQASHIINDDQEMPLARSSEDLSLSGYLDPRNGQVVEISSEDDEADNIESELRHIFEDESVAPSPNENLARLPSSPERDHPSRNWREGKTIKQMMEYILNNDVDTRKDVTFFIGPAKVPILAHKTYLALVSIAFDYAFFKSPTTERPLGHLSIGISNTTPQAFKMMLQYVYCRCIDWNAIPEIRIKEAINVWEFAHNFQMEDLSDRAARVIKELMNVEIAPAILNLAVSLRHDNLKEFALQFILMNAKKTLHSSEILECSSEAMYCILGCDNLYMNELSIFNAAIRWADYRIRKRMGDSDFKSNGSILRTELGKALYFIRFPLFDKHDFAEFVLKNLIGLMQVEDELKMLRFFTYPEGMKPDVTPFSANPRVSLIGTVTSRVAPATSSSDLLIINGTGPIPATSSGWAGLVSALPKDVDVVNVAGRDLARQAGRRASSEANGENGDGQPPRKVMKRGSNIDFADVNEEPLPPLVGMTENDNEVSASGLPHSSQSQSESGGSINHDYDGQKSGLPPSSRSESGLSINRDDHDGHEFEDTVLIPPESPVVLNAQVSTPKVDHEITGPSSAIFTSTPSRRRPVRARKPARVFSPIKNTRTRNSAKKLCLVETDSDEIPVSADTDDGKRKDSNSGSTKDSDSPDSSDSSDLGYVPRGRQNLDRSATSSPRRSSSRNEDFLDEHQLNYIRNNEHGSGCHNLTSWHQDLSVGLDDASSQTMIDSIVCDDPVVINVHPKGFLPLLEFPNLIKFDVKYLYNAKHAENLKFYLNTLAPQNNLLFFKKSTEDTDDLSTLWISKVDVNLEVNGIKVLNIDHVMDSLTVSWLTGSAASILEGLKSDIRQIHIDTTPVDLNKIPTGSLELLTLRNIQTNKKQNLFPFIRKCHQLRDLSCDDVKGKFVGLVKDFGLFGDNGLQHLRKIALGNARLECLKKIDKVITKSPVEELYLDGCCCKPEWVESVPFVFPNLKKASLTKTVNLRLILKLLEIDSLEWLGVSGLIFASSCVRTRSNSEYESSSVDNSLFQLPLSYAEDKIKMKRILTDAGLGEDTEWLNYRKKFFILKRIIPKKGRKGGWGSAPSHWTGVKYEDPILAEEKFSQLTYEHFGYNAIYSDYDLFAKMTK